MRPIPKSRIQESLYTNGTGIGQNIALRYINDQKPYIGFYNIVNGSKYSTGKTFDSNSQSLEIYNVLSQNTTSIVSSGSVPTLKNSLINSGTIRYFYKDLSTSNILIKEIDKNTYNQLAGQSLFNYQVISYDPNTQTLEEVNSQMPGLIAFLGI